MFSNSDRRLSGSGATNGEKISLDALPVDVRGTTNAAHQEAIAGAKAISAMVKEVTLCLGSASDETLPAPLRGGFLRAGDEHLDTIIRIAQEAKDDLRRAHCPPALREAAAR